MTPESSHNLDLIKSRLSMGGAGSMNSIKDAAKKLSGAKSSGISDAEKKRWKASLDFEAMFLGNMYKSMRQSTLAQGNELTEASPGREMFTEMLDNQYASLHSKSPLESGEQGLKNAKNGLTNSMAAQIYRSLSRQDAGKDKTDATLAALKAPALDALPIVDGSADGSSDESAGDLFSTTPGLARIINGHAGQARTGQVTSAAALSDDKLQPIVDLAAKTFNVSANLIKSVIKTESANQPLAVSGAGAKGLMQLMDSTARDMGVSNVFNVHENVLAGTRYLKQLLNRFNGSEEKALAAYNAGPGTVDRFGGIPPYSETQDYVKKVLKNKNELDAAAHSVAGN